MVKFLITKRTNKNLTAEQFWAEKNKNKKGQDQGPPPRYVNIDKRYHFVRPTEKLDKLDVNVAHYINEIKIEPYSQAIDNIGIIFQHFFIIIKVHFSMMILKATNTWT
jgi:hypothetical protein